MRALLVAVRSRASRILGQALLRRVVGHVHASAGVGGGAAGLDCNGDRKTDLFIAGGKNPAGLYVNRSATGGELKFEKTETGLERFSIFDATK